MFSLQGRTVHDFILRDGELVCADLSTIRADEVGLDLSTGDFMGCYEDKVHEIVLCDGCYDTLIRTLLEDRRSAESLLMLCLRHFMWRGNQQGDIQDQIKTLIPGWEKRLEEL